MNTDRGARLYNRPRFSRLFGAESPIRLMWPRASARLSRSNRLSREFNCRGFVLRPFGDRDRGAEYEDWQSQRAEELEHLKPPRAPCFRIVNHLLSAMSHLKNAGDGSRKASTGQSLWEHALGVRARSSVPGQPSDR
ncbi:hypothetical protein SFHH103_01333 [Sinorhizobium fredii HH103]|uniref:Uncharacterized protein n=1 Tax=Sinorhizobium fredii (strain HH103) TaxID=1117943 RepID=G9A6F1_SINF1|nr:hypothetical protein SFHH103_01333 [Sinorhizobium fredii HH103]